MLLIGAFLILARVSQIHVIYGSDEGNVAEAALALAPLREAGMAQMRAMRRAVEYIAIQRSSEFYGRRCHSMPLPGGNVRCVEG